MTGDWRRWAKIAIDAALTIVILLVGYAAAGFVGASIPANPGWREPASGIRVYVETNGVHTDLIVPVAAMGVDWRNLIRPEDLRDPRYAAYDHLAFGWGERRFYLETPTWGDVSARTVLAAAIGSSETLMHVEYLPEPAPGIDVRAITLRPEEYRRLATFLRAGFRSKPGARPEHLYGYGDYDAFYSGSGYYDAFMTCNAWTGAALRHAGVRVGAWTPFSVTVMGWF